MKQLLLSDPDYSAKLAVLDRRAEPDPSVRDTVAGIIAAVRERGDEALAEFGAKFDGCSLSGTALRVTDQEITKAIRKVAKSDRDVLRASLRNVQRFARKGLRKDWSITNAQGAEVGERYLPFERVGLYVPGGSAPLVSTVMMTVGLAATAGCPEIVVCTPPGPDGSVNAALLTALRMAGATEVYKVGGAQAIAALAYGTETIRPVQKIFGPGNRFVVEAKRQCFGSVAIDLLPGPSEVMVLADDSARADFVAADLLAQAEHGGDSAAVLVTDSAAFLEKVREEITRQAATLSRQVQLESSLASGGWLIQVASIQEGAALVNRYAPEHVSLVVRNEAEILPLVRTAGAVFLGSLSPVSVGDFLAGPSHTLPTGGAGKSFAGLTVDQFQRRGSIIRLNREAIAASAPLVEAFSALEGLDAHGRSARIRVEG